MCLGGGRWSEKKHQEVVPQKTVLPMGGGSVQMGLWVCDWVPWSALWGAALGTSSTPRNLRPNIGALVPFLENDQQREFRPPAVHLGDPKIIKSSKRASLLREAEGMSHASPTILRLHPPTPVLHLPSGSMLEPASGLPLPVPRLQHELHQTDRCQAGHWHAPD